ncbi:cytidylyltransferase domain-containing protein [Candidatus Methylopumilus planktonicus]|uniref:cytidylyltransferase domain-containing protein n=1 Tax=Candidatus Methylopumilus planktonicus TaxID=1581557 RepID=UPI003BEECFEF
MEVLGKPLLEYLIRRLQRVKLANQICIACTVNDTDQPIVNLANKLRVSVHRGDEQDVLSRHYEAAIKFGADHIMRVTSDCPLIDPEQLDYLISEYLSQSGQIDYMSSGMVRTYPRGMEAEVFSFKALELAYNNATKDYEREHVTPYLYQHPELFKLVPFLYSNDQSHHRWTVDTIEDFLLIEKIISSLYPSNPNFLIEDILNLLSVNQEWVKINCNIEQKNLGVK